MTECSASNCSSRSIDGYTMYRFPSNLTRKNKWIKNCNREDWSPSPSSRLCSKHFEDSEIKENPIDGLMVLKSSAIPTLFDNPNPSQSPKHRKGKRHHKDNNSLKGSKHSKLSDENNGFLKIENFSYENISQVCRACLNTDCKNMSSLFEGRMRDMFNDTTNLNISENDNLPTQLCINCSETISKLSEFRLMCHTSDTTLRYLIDTKEGIKSSMDINFESINDIPNAEDNSDDDYFLSTIKNYVGDDDSDSFVLKSENDSNSDDEDDDDDNYKNKTKRSLKKKVKSKKHKLESKPRGTKLHVSNDLECGLCPNVYKNFEELSSHIDTHKDDKCCNNCKKEAYDWPDLVCHRYRHFMTIPKKLYLCYVCKHPSRSIDGLEFHIRKHHCGGLGGACKICNKTFDRLVYVKKHMRHVHVDEKNFECEYCLKRFKSGSQLNSHLRTHTTERKYVCAECGSSFKFPGGLRCHELKSHGPEQIYDCDKCPKKFKSKDGLFCHKRVHNVKSICPECGKSVSKISLKVHMMSHTGERPHPCKICPASFTTSTMLLNHIRRHTGERKYGCKYCTRAFFTKSVLVKHTRTHTGEKPFVCKVCDKGFTGGHNLRVHMKVHGENLIVNKKTALIEDNSALTCQLPWGVQSTSK